MSIKGLLGATYFVSILLGVIVCGTLLTGCGTQTIKVKGGTTHESYSEVGGEVKTVTEIVLKVDVSGCQGLDGADQGQCIKDTVQALGDLVELVKSLSCKDARCLGE